MAIVFEITKIITTFAKDGTTVDKLVFDMTATETDDTTGDRIAQAVIDAAIENPPAGDARDIIVQYAKDEDWKQHLLDRIDAKKAISEKTVELKDLSTITTVVSDDEITKKP